MAPRPENVAPSTARMREDNESANALERFSLHVQGLHLTVGVQLTRGHFESIATAPGSQQAKLTFVFIVRCIELMYKIAFE